MMKKIFFVLLMLPIISHAQKKHHEVGIFGGTSSYFGDLRQEIFPEGGYRACGGLVYKYFVHPNVGFRVGVNYASLYGADSASKVPAIKARNLDFQTNILEFNWGIEANMLPVETDQYKISPYVFAQMALFYFDPYTQDADLEKLYLRPLSTEGQGLRQYPDRRLYSKVNMAFPLGFGFRTFIGQKVMLNAEMGFRYTLTDYLDDVSKTYVNMDTLFKYKGQQSVDFSYRGDELKTWDENYPNYGFKRGDNRATDWYWFGGISVSIYFDARGNSYRDRNSRCPRRVSSSRR